MRTPDVPKEFSRLSVKRIHARKKGSGWTVIEYAWHSMTQTLQHDHGSKSWKYCLITCIKIEERCITSCLLLLLQSVESLKTSRGGKDIIQTSIDRERKRWIASSHNLDMFELGEMLCLSGIIGRRIHAPLFSSCWYLKRLWTFLGHFMCECVMAIAGATYRKAYPNEKK